MKFVSVQTYKEKLPARPGVYAFHGRDGVLYIGKAANLQERVKNHFQQPSYRDHLFVGQVQKIGHIETPSEIDALLLESALIKKHQPKYNVTWKDDKKYFYVEITKEPLPRVFVVHQPDKAGPSIKYQVLGPFTDGRALKFALRALRRTFPYYTSKKTHGKLPCGYCRLELCPGLRPDVKAYKKNLRNLALVLKGKRMSVAAKLKKEMAALSEQKQYERAGILRDQIYALEKIASHSVSAFSDDKTSSLREEPYAVVEKSVRRMLGARQPIRRIEEFDISNIQGQFAAASMVVFINGKPSKAHYRRFKIDISRGRPALMSRRQGRSNDTAMMREAIERRLAHREWQFPDVLIADGGKGQLKAALKAVESFEKKTGEKFRGILAALAKQKTELFVPERRDSIRLGMFGGPVQNLFLRVRDEAHRFAVSYHKILRKKAMLQS